MPRLIKYLKIVIFVAAIIGLIVFAAKTYDKPLINKAGNILSVVIRPEQKALYSASQYVDDIITSISELGSIKRENVRLKEQLLKLQEQDRRVQELTIENKSLKGMLKFTKENPDIRIVGASIISRNSLFYFDTFTINAGKSKGIKPGMAVITNMGLVGKVTQVSDTWSKVLSILDESSAVSVIDNRTRDNGIAKGNQPKSDKLTAEYFPIDSHIEAGDTVITSGLGELFPKGIFVGYITEVHQSTGNLMKIATISPSVDFQRLENVYVIVTNEKAVQFDSIGY